MIILSRLNGESFALNADLIERAESTPDTVLTLRDGTKYVVAETVENVIDKIRDFQASILIAVQEKDPNHQPPMLHLMSDAGILDNKPRS